MDVLVSRVRKTDKNLNLIRSMDEICFPDDAVPFIGLRKHLCWVAKINEDNIGYASGYKQRNYFYLSRGGVLPEYRGKNIQIDLIKKRIEHAQFSRLDGVITYTSIDNIPSIKNLVSCGFSEWIDAPKWFKKNYDKDFIMWKLDFRLNHFGS